MDIISKIHHLLLEVSENAYNEGRIHERNSNSPHIKRAYEVNNKTMPESFKETETYKGIMKEYKTE